MIAPLLKIAAASMAARTLRQAADDAARLALMSLLGGIALAVGMACLSGAAFVILRDRFGSAEAWGALGAFYAVAALAAFFFARRRRGA